MFDKLCKKYLPIYFRFWPTSYWLAIWSAPFKTSAWAALRFTIRKGKYHSLLVGAIKKGTV